MLKLWVASSRSVAFIPIVSAPAKLSVLDANGSLLQTVNVTLDARNVGRSFRLPENAVAGGYELRLAYRNQVYSSSFA